MMVATEWSPGDLDPAAGGVARQVEQLVRRRIETGRIPVDAALPAERELAARLRVSRGSVVRGYAALRDAGVAVTRQGSGTVVARTDRLMDPISPLTVDPDADLIDLRHASTAAPGELREIYREATDTELREVFGGDGPPPGGSPALRETIARALSGEALVTEVGDVAIEADHLTLTVGAAAGLNAIVTGLELDSGTVITETPTYPAALDIVRRHGLRPVAWPAGADGWDPDELRRLCRQHRPRLIYLQADNHNPTGLSLPAGTRSAVVETARSCGAVLVSDETLRPLWLRDHGQQPDALGSCPGVLTVGSLSKMVWGGLRVGWVRSSRRIRRRVARATFLASSSPSALDELMAARLLGTGGMLDRIVARRSRLLRENLIALETGLRPLREAGCVCWQTPTGGMTLWLALRGRRHRRAIESAAAAGVLLAGGGSFDPVADDPRHLRIAFTAPPRTLTEVAARLTNAWQ